MKGRHNIKYTEDIQLDNKIHCKRNSAGIHQFYSSSLEMMEKLYDSLGKSDKSQVQIRFDEVTKTHMIKTAMKTTFQRMLTKMEVVNNA